MVGLRRNTPILHYSNTPFCLLASHLEFPNFLLSVTTSCYGVSRNKQFCSVTPNLTPTRTIKLMLDAVIAVITNGEKVLFIQRAPNIRGGGYWAPVSGEVTEGNQAIVDDPSIVNSDPQGAGWFFKLKLKNASDADALLDEAAYKDLIA